MAAVSDRIVLTDMVFQARHGVAEWEKVEPQPFAVGQGIAEEKVCLDPGIGFGKTPEQNVEVLRNLGRLRELERPILLGTSRKSTLGLVLDLPPDQRLEATLATTVLGVAAGADMVRVHDVQANARAARMADAVVRGWRR